jgi:hypothetical protein
MPAPRPWPSYLQFVQAFFNETKTTLIFGRAQSKSSEHKSRGQRTQEGGWSCGNQSQTEDPKPGWRLRVHSRWSSWLCDNRPSRTKALCIGMAHCMPRMARESHEPHRLSHCLPTEESEMVPLRKTLSSHIYVSSNQASRSKIRNTMHRKVYGEMRFGKVLSGGGRWE